MRATNCSCLCHAIVQELLEKALEFGAGVYPLATLSDLKALIERGADVSATLPAMGGRTALHTVAAGAFWGGAAQAVALLAAAGAAPNVRDERGRTPIHAACEEPPGGEWGAPFYSDKAEAVTALLAAGADPSAADADGCTPLHLLADFLAEARPPTGDEDGDCIVPGWADMAGAVGELLAAGADLEAKDWDGRSAREALAECMAAIFGEPVAALLAPQPASSE